MNNFTYFLRSGSAFSMLKLVVEKRTILKRLRPNLLLFARLVLDSYSSLRVLSCCFHACLDSSGGSRVSRAS